MSTKKTIFGSLGAIFILILSQTLAGLVASLFVILSFPMAICNVIAGILYIVFAISILIFYAKKILEEELVLFNVTKFKLEGRWAIVAVFLPCAVIGIYLLFPGEFVSSSLKKQEILTSLSAGVFFTGLAAGIVEELVFRGFVMNLLKNRWNKWVGIFVPSVLFGAVHLIGNQFNLLSSILILVAGTLVGAMFSVIELESNSVWNNAFVHAVWNIFIIGGSFKIGAHVDKQAVWTYVLKNKTFVLTGGEFGIESSIISVIAYLVIIIFAIRLMQKREGFRVNNSR